jgi:hypothetical protein
LQATNASAVTAVLFALLAAASTATLAQGFPSNEPAFTEFVANKVRQEVGDSPGSVMGPLTLSVGALQANLDRIFAFCRADASGCAREVDHYAKGIAQVLKRQTTPLNPNSLRVVVRTTEYIEAAQASFGPSGPILQTRPLADGLVAVAVLDTPRATRPLNERDLKALHLSQDELFNLAGKNTVAALPPMGKSARPAAIGQIGSFTGDLYEVGRVAIHSQCAELARAQRGTLLIAIPTTDTVLYISEDTPVAIDALRTLASNMMTRAPNPLAPAILRWTRDRWEVVR